MAGTSLSHGFGKWRRSFSAPWDLIIVDEAHEGTRTELGQAMLSLLRKRDPSTGKPVKGKAATRVLELSGTPFNLLDEYQEGGGKAAGGSTAASMRGARARATSGPPADVEAQRKLWDEVLRENIFIVCKTKMARAITLRTLRGFRTGVRCNVRAFDDFINQFRNKPDLMRMKLRNGAGYWKTNEETAMHFNAIVGNPPYQEMGGSGGTNDASIYQLFCSAATELEPDYVSMVIPSRWFAGGRENLLGEFRRDMLGEGQKRTIAYVRRADIKKNVTDIDFDKVFIAAAGGSGNDPNILAAPIVAPKKSVCSQTFIYAKFDSAEEAENFAAYLKTRFFRALVSARKIDQHTPSKVYSFVPVQDFTRPWTDADLFAKYALDAPARKWIETNIREMN